MKTQPTEEYSQFRREICGLIQVISWNDHIKSYFRFLKRVGFRGRFDMVTREGFEGKKVYFGTMTVDERIERVLDLPWEERERLEKCLRKNAVKIIRPLYESHISSEKANKKQMVAALVQKFFSKEADHEKREKDVELMEEAENLLSGEVKMCQHNLPVLLLREIFSFIPCNQDLIYTIGRVSQIFYFTALSSWKRISVSGRNLYSFSLLVLKHVESIEIKSNLENDELEFLLSHVGEDKVKRLVISSSVSISNRKKILKRLSDKNETCGLRFLRDLEFKWEKFSKRGSQIFWTSKEIWDTNWDDVDLGIAFPRLESIEDVPNLYLISDSMECLNHVSLANMRVITKKGKKKKGRKRKWESEEDTNEYGSFYDDDEYEFPDSVKSLKLMASMESTKFISEMMERTSNLKRLWLDLGESIFSMIEKSFDQHSFFKKIPKNLDSFRVDLHEAGIGTNRTVPTCPNFRKKKLKNIEINLYKSRGMVSGGFLYSVMGRTFDDGKTYISCFKSFMEQYGDKAEEIKLSIHTERMQGSTFSFHEQENKVLRLKYDIDEETKVSVGKDVVVHFLSGLKKEELCDYKHLYVEVKQIYLLPNTRINKKKKKAKKKIYNALWDLGEMFEKSGHLYVKKKLGNTKDELREYVTQKYHFFME